ncbi:class I SAM-dependent methyltransferase [Parablautia muri]|uniref:Class I SAM-dependent methyltransferase n=1 Tax=Parablautia muri TaxID=2320879 RepID=A0A9X5BEW2_9FIRM|nr:class I SAM-dependent methyltransferase [Parablautia muri]NBJ92526.1 class I SAM-dependent methyltransferase [Parablautia muri]
MNRKEYWNKEYTTYWKAMTEEANSEGAISRIKKTTSGDYKTPGEKIIIEFFESLHYEKTDKLLDYGCGFGRFYPFFNRITDYYGIDISQAMIDECISRYPEDAEKFIVAEGERLPFEDNYFNKIICYGVFDACYQENAISEMLRVSKVGGSILVTGKNTEYYDDDEQALIAEEAARKKGHPNYFTNVKSLVSQLGQYAYLKQERYFTYRGDFANAKYTDLMPDKFYEWALVIEKKNHLDIHFEKFSDAYSNTWKKKIIKVQNRIIDGEDTK